MANFFKSAFLMTLMIGLLVVIGQLVGGTQGAVMFFVIGMVLNFGSFLFSDKIVIKMYRGYEPDYNRYAWLYDMIKELAERAEFPVTPKLYIVPMETPNAFATGRSPSRSAVAVTEGILQMLSKDELAGVIAHELGHIKHRDTLIATIAASIASAIMWITYFARITAIFGDDDDSPVGLVGVILVSVFGSVAATIIQLAISRSREYLADDFSAKIIGNGRSLSNALLKLHGYRPNRNSVNEISPATSHLFIAPSRFAKGLSSLFSTHPSLEERLENLSKF